MYCVSKNKPPLNHSLIHVRLLQRRVCVLRARQLLPVWCERVNNNGLSMMSEEGGEKRGGGGFVKKQASQSAARLIPYAHVIGPAPWHCCLEFTTHVGSRTLTRALICRDPTPKTRPCQVLLWYWPSFRDHRRHHHHHHRSHPPPPLLRLVFSIREEGKYPSRELRGLAEAAAASPEASEFTSATSLRCSP